MHIRTSTTRSNGKVYEYVQLVDSYRRPSDGMPATRVIASLGKLPPQVAANLKTAFAASRAGKSVVLWFDDHCWWVGLVEFQPSSWSRGTFLNVGVAWLWFEKDYFSFDVGYRLEGFVPFLNEDQFVPEARRLAEKAAKEILYYREEFSSLNKAADYIARTSTVKNLWSLYYAGVCCGLVGRSMDAVRYLQGVLAQSPFQRPWEKRIATVASHLLKLLDDPARFLAAIEVTLTTTREMLKLSPNHIELSQFIPT